MLLMNSTHYIIMSLLTPSSISYNICFIFNNLFAIGSFRLRKNHPTSSLNLSRQRASSWP